MMDGRWKSGRPREPSEHGIDVDEIEVTARKATTLADDLGSRQSGRLKQDGGRLRDGSAEGPSDGGRRFRQRRQQGSPEKAAETFGEADTAEVCDSGTLEERHVAPAADVGADVTARRETTLADELGVEPSGRLKQGASRQHSVLADGGSPTRTKGRRLQGQPQRLRAESAEGAAATAETGGKACGAPAHAGKLRPSKAARHALRFAEDAVAVAGSSVMNENDGDVSEDAVREGGRRLAPAGRRALPRSRRASGAGCKAPVGPDGAVKATGAGTAPPPASARLRDAPSSSTAPAGEPGAVRKTPGATGNGGGIHGFWRRGRWKKAARAEAAARNAATTGEAGTLQGIVAVKARLRRMFTAGGAGRAGIALAATAALAVMFAASALSTCATLATGIADAMAATSYMAEDADIRGADEAYTRMEAALEGEAQAGESSHPGYDEYRYQIGELGHDPYALASILTARYGDYEASQVTGFLQEILDAQYSLTFEESSETETVTAIDPATGEESVQETVRRILTVRLVNRGLDYAVRKVLTEGERGDVRDEGQQGGPLPRTPCRQLRLHRRRLRLAAHGRGNVRREVRGHVRRGQQVPGVALRVGRRVARDGLRLQRLRQLGAHGVRRGEHRPPDHRRAALLLHAGEPRAGTCRRPRVLHGDVRDGFAHQPRGHIPRRRDDDALRRPHPDNQHRHPLLAGPPVRLRPHIVNSENALPNGSADEREEKR